MKISNIASGLVILGLGLVGTASAQTIERGVHKVTIDNSTSPAAETYEGNDRNREVRYTNSATNTDIGGRDYRETAHSDTTSCNSNGICGGQHARSESTGTVLNADHGNWVNVSAGETAYEEQVYVPLLSNLGLEYVSTSSRRFVSGDLANDKAGVIIEESESGFGFAVGPPNEDNTGTTADPSTQQIDTTTIGAYANSNEATVSRQVSGTNTSQYQSTGVSTTIAQRSNGAVVVGDLADPNAAKGVFVIANTTGTFGDLYFEDIGRSGDDPAKVNGYVTQGGTTLAVVDTDAGAAPTQSVTFSNGSTLVAVNRTGADQPQSLEVIAAGNGFTGDNVATFTPAEDGAGRTPTVTYTNYARGVSIEAGDEGVYRQGVRVDVAYVFVDANLREDLLTSTGDAYVQVLNQSADVDVLSHPLSPTTTEIDLTALDAVEVTLYADGSLPAVAFGPAMPMGGLIGVLLDQDFVGNTIANNGFAQAILGNGFVQNGLEAASPVTDQVPGQ